MKIKKNKIIITGGYLKSRVVKTINHPLIKPTTNFSRQILFNWLGQTIINANCLDCFAGSGVLSFEAISRNARYITMLENNFFIFKQLLYNTSVLSIGVANIIYTNALKWLNNTKEIFDIVFIDPPFKSNLIDKTISIISRKKILSNFSLIYIESKITTYIDTPKVWVLHKQKLTKNVAYRLYYRKPI
ncbi:MAG: 16S rRNA (guanine(966)-N(2))-methyltransferase RsmD [Candidatus Lightella neohaematopini]|nr:16S rRNA (guanine(966)-N(2))-methyltransferase RsmD [Candidatus Lightella neohaematopini]